MTILVQDRAEILGEVIAGQVVLSTFGRIVRDCWLRNAENRPGIEMAEYVVMPNHVHGIICIRAPTSPIGLRTTPPSRRQMALSKAVGRFKMVAAKYINYRRRTPGTRVWQRSYYERIIRNEAEYQRIVRYIALNPRRWDDNRPG